MPPTPKQERGLDGVDVPSSDEYGTLDLDDPEWMEALSKAPKVSREMSVSPSKNHVPMSTRTPFQTPFSSPKARRRSSDVVLSQEKDEVTIPQFKGKKRLAPEDRAVPAAQKIGRLVDAVPVSHYEAVVSRKSSSSSASTAYVTPSMTPTTSSEAGTAQTSFESNLGDDKDHSRTATTTSHASAIGPPRIVPPASDPIPDSKQEAKKFDVEAYLNKNVKSRTPFPVLPDIAQCFSYRVRYEVTRVALHTGVPEKDLFQELKDKRLVEVDCYGDLWSTFASYVHGRSKKSSNQRPIKSTLPERCSDEVWAKAKTFVEHVDMSAELTISTVKEDRLFSMKLKPFKLSRSNRTTRKYGSDRLLTIDIPHIEPRELPDVLKPYADQVVNFVIEWILGNRHHFFLGRLWAAWYVKPLERARAVPSVETEDKLRFGSRLYFIALSGNLDLVQGPNKSSRFELRGIEQFLDWALTLDANKSQPIPKLFSRLQLVLSATLKTDEFNQKQILRRDNAYSDSPGRWELKIQRSNEKKKNPHERRDKNGASVMNDGCARMSKKAVQYIVESLRLDYAPCAFQGRIAGAKGMWMIDALGESLTTFNFGAWNDNNRGTDPSVWIELTDEQVKFETTRRGQPFDPNPDPSKSSFEVLDYVKPLSIGYLNFQVLSVLLANKVPLEVFVKLLNEDITDKAEKMKNAMQDPLALAAFLQKNHPVRSQRVAANGIEMQGGLPFDLVERILCLVNSGFSPLDNRLLRQLCLKQINLRNQRLIDKMSIGVGRSTRAFILPDPMDVLKEGECFLYFSSTFDDPRSGEKVVSLHDRDVLVARSPVLERSDIQKVRAVFKPELEPYKDVVIFSCRGKVSLAHLLSGGDFDGDKVWICWEPDIVTKFRNFSSPVEPKTLSELGMQQNKKSLAELLPHETDDPAKHKSAITTFLQEGISLNMRQSLLPTVNAYYDKYIYRFGYDVQAQQLSSLCASLLDASKAGFDFTRSDWDSFQNRNNLPKDLPKPAYKTQEERRLASSRHPIDKLVYGARKLVEELKSDFETKFKPEDVSPSDRDLVALIEGEEKACRWEPGLKAVLDHLKKDLKSLHEDWKEKMVPSPAKKWSEQGFRMYCDQLRRRFLRIQPLADSPSITGRRWRNDFESKCQLSTRGTWVLLKASAFFKMTNSGNCAWWVCGQELCRIKADAQGGTIPIIRKLYDLSSVDARLFERIQMKERLLEAKDAEFEDTAADGSDDEFGGFDWAAAQEVFGLENL